MVIVKTFHVSPRSCRQSPQPAPCPDHRNREHHVQIRNWRCLRECAAANGQNDLHHDVDGVAALFLLSMASSRASLRWAPMPSSAICGTTKSLVKTCTTATAIRNIPAKRNRRPDPRTTNAGMCALDALNHPLDEGNNGREFRPESLIAPNVTNIKPNLPKEVCPTRALPAAPSLANVAFFRVSTLSNRMKRMTLLM